MSDHLSQHYGTARKATMSAFHRKLARLPTSIGPETPNTHPHGLAHGVALYEARRLELNLFRKSFETGKWEWTVMSYAYYLELLERQRKVVLEPDCPWRRHCGTVEGRPCCDAKMEQSKRERKRRDFQRAVSEKVEVDGVGPREGLAIGSSMGERGSIDASPERKVERQDSKLESVTSISSGPDGGRVVVVTATVSTLAVFGEKETDQAKRTTVRRIGQS